MSSIVPVNGIVFKRLRARKTPKYVPFKIYRKCISVSIFDFKNCLDCILFGVQVMCSDVCSIRTILPTLAKWYNNAKKALEKSKTNSQPHSSHSLISYILAYELVLSSIHVKNKTNFQLKIVWTVYSSEYRLHRLGVGSTGAIIKLCNHVL